MDLSVADSPFAAPGEEQQRDKDRSKTKEPRVGRACDVSILFACDALCRWRTLKWSVRSQPCRRAKVRCLAQPDQPCARCMNAKLECTFEQKATKRGPPKGCVLPLAPAPRACRAVTEGRVPVSARATALARLLTRGASLSHSYVESLERRLEAMEALLRALSATSGADMDQLPSTDYDLDDRAEDPGSSRDQSTPSSIAAMSPEASARIGLSGDSVDRLAADLEELSVDKVCLRPLQ